MTVNYLKIYLVGEKFALNYAVWFKKVLKDHRLEIKGKGP